MLSPGTGFSYANLNYVLAGHLVETITGMTWWDAMATIVLRPLGVDPAAVGQPGRTPFERPIATGHSVNATLGRTRPVQQSLKPVEAPAGALALSAVDLVALGLVHVAPGVPDVLPPAFAERMRRPVPGGDPFGLADGWGLGLAVFRDGASEWVGHDGNANGTSCYLRVDPDAGCVVALTTNANTGSALWDELRTALPQLKLPPIPHYRDVSSRAPVRPPAGCAGSYTNGSSTYLITAADDGRLYLAHNDERIAWLDFYDGTDFVLRDLTSGHGLHVGRFRRDPVTKQVDQLLVLGRVARRRPPPSEAEHLGRAAALDRLSA